MKRILGSLAIGIFPSAAVFSTIITLKIFFPGSRIGIALLWFFVWPALLLVRLFPNLSVNEVLLIAFPVALFINIAVVALPAYLVMRTIRR